MIIYKTVSQKLLGSIVSMLSAILGVLFFHLPLWKGPMYGDDFLLVSAALQPNGNEGFLQDIWLSGGGKWRPISTPILLWLAKQFEYSYLPYQLLNLILLLICAVIAGQIAFYLSSSLLASATISLAVSVSHFTWLSQISVYGVMELLAAIFFLLAFFCALKSFESGDNNSNSQSFWHISSAILLLMSTFSHERYLFTTIVFWLFFQIVEVKTKSRRLAFLFLLIPLVHIVIKAVVLGLDPIAGGGESNFQDVRGWWIIRHVADAILGLFGFYSGSGIYYSDWPLGRLAKQSDFGFLGISIVLLPFLLMLLILFSKSRGKIRVLLKRFTTDRTLLILAASIFFTLLPATTVIQRIEMRWLFIPQILLMLLSISIVSHFNIDTKLKTIALLMLPFSFVLISLFYRSESKTFTTLRDQPSMLIKTLEHSAPAKGNWLLVLTQTNPQMPTNWQLGYGGVFSQMNNPPYQILSTSQECKKINTSLPCITAMIDGASDQFEIKVD